MTIKDENQNVILKSNVNNAITFTGRRYDSESNLYYYRNRMYSPELGRFISKDPKGYIDGMNLYAYVKNNPLKYLDAMGTTAYQRFSDSRGTGTVSYSISGRTNDYSVSYDDYSGFGNSGSSSYWHDDSGNYASYNSKADMTTASWDAGSYQKFNNEVSVFKDEAISVTIVQNSNRIDRSSSNQQYTPDINSVTLQTLYGNSEQVNSRAEYNRRAGEVYITGHRVGGIGPIHTAIEYTNSNGQTRWISAGPSGLEDNSVMGYLKSGVGEIGNDVRESDKPSNNMTLGIIAPSSNITNSEYFKQLEKLNNYFKTKSVNYDLFPEISDSYNSNSFVFGLINVSGATSSIGGKHFTGGDKPLPNKYFGVR